ncbi:MAG: DUF3566 domain-containing protein [Bryobacteraceae bacterium]
MIVKRLRPLSCAKIAGVFYAAMGLLMGCLVWIPAFLVGVVSNSQRASATVMPPTLGSTLGIGAITIFPILFAVIGFLFGLMQAWLYNLIASAVGGVEIDLA